jgi:sulfatase maturation enzyme AslB (radical SAM superfamily)
MECVIMPNIMINKTCNLQCPYCFANEFVNQDSYIDKNNITEENFIKALEFSTKGQKPVRIGIIGGEPTLHPNFSKFVKLAAEHPKVNKVLIFTNGILLDKYFGLLANPKVCTLINANSPKDIGEERYKKMVKSIDFLINECNLENKISLGINMYKPDFDYSYMVELLTKYKFKTLRTAIAVPNMESKKVNALEYFSSMKPRVFDFFRELEKINCMPTYDCNNMPRCVLTEDEAKWLQGFWKMESTANRRCTITDLPNCKPVIDILPNLETVRCFGCSDCKANIDDFSNVEDLEKYFYRNYDIYTTFTDLYEKCKTCYYKKTNNCTGGCLAFKSNSIKEIKEKLGEI